MSTLKVKRDTIDILFANARSQNGWLLEPVTDDQIAAAYEIAKWGPTSMNTQPLRCVCLRSPEAKERIRPALNPGNVEKVITAPVVAIFAYDLEFYTHLHRTFPHNKNAPNAFLGKDAHIQGTAFRNGTLQAAYMILALRAVGLDVGPMSGFNNAKVDAEFFPGSSYRSNFICGIGHGDSGKLMGRLPRLEWHEISQTL